MEYKDLYCIKCGEGFLFTNNDNQIDLIHDRDAVGTVTIKELGHLVEEEGNNRTEYAIFYGEVDSVVNSEFACMDAYSYMASNLPESYKLVLKQIAAGHKKIDFFARLNEGKLVTACDRVRIGKFKAFFKHLHTINRHRRIVRHYCFKAGLFWQGLTHDLSKYSPVEFWEGVNFYQGTRSPTVAARMEKGYSDAWMHHKGRNRHHYEYWTDYDVVTGELLAFKPMPKKYLAESCMDRIAACKVYSGDSYTDSAPLNYLKTRDSESHMNPYNRETLTMLLTILSESGEKAFFDYIKHEF